MKSATGTARTETGTTYRRFTGGNIEAGPNPVEQADMSSALSSQANFSSLTFFNHRVKNGIQLHGPLSTTFAIALFSAHHDNSSYDLFGTFSMQE